MTKSELESKPLAELHALAAEANVPRYRMLRREELIEKLAGGDAAEKPRERRESRPRRERRPRERSERQRSRERSARPEPEAKADKPEPTSERSPEAPATEERRPRRRRRRRFGRKRKELRLHDLVASGGRQTIVYAETREACTTLLRELAGELASESNGSDPIALLVDPGPEELAEWRREAPQAEIVAAAQARHAEDAIAQATRRAEGGESVIVLIDSLTRLADLGDAGGCAELLDAARSVSVVAALEHH